MSQTTERVSSVRELLTPFTTVMVCNDVIGLLPVRVQQQGVDTTPFTIMAGHIVEVQHLLPAGTSVIGQQSDWHEQ